MKIMKWNKEAKNVTVCKANIQSIKGHKCKIKTKIMGKVMHARKHAILGLH